MPKYKKEELRPPPVKITGAGPPIKNEPKPAPKPEPKAPPPSPPATPPTPSPPPPPPPSPVFEAPQHSPPETFPKRLPSVFDKKPKKKKKKKRKKPPPRPKPKPIECDDPDVCGDDVCGEGQGDLGQMPSIFVICHIPATRQGQGYDDDRGYGAKEDRSGQTSPRSGEEEDDGPNIPPAVPSYMRPDEFAGIFGKKIDARNLAEVGPHGWHPTANAPYDITDTGDTVTVGPSGWREPRSE